MVEYCQTNMLSLYGGALQWSIGQVVDILYKKNENPNCGNYLPKDVIVNFKQYRGPPCDVNNPTRVCTARCDFGCCLRRHIPGWVKTIHSYECPSFPMSGA
jgi:hypothetical protein